ncbi:MAG: energy transducer TonB [Bryobacteraceae bacterium]|nr:energy transducer TonB [Bryobacteraceae bacterium]
MFSQSSTGAGGLVGTGNPFGTRFGWYAQLVIQRISQKWRTEDVDARLQTANICSVSFDIQQDGSVRNVRIDQSSGNYAVDRSTERAVLESSPFPALPDGFERKSARVQVNFQFKR